MSHPAFDLLSAYSDGELAPAQAEAVQRHLVDCVACRSDISAFSTVDSALQAVPTLACAAARSLVSAALDDELLPEEMPVLSHHLTGCAACAADRATWASLEQRLATMPVVAPPARVDAAIGRLVDRPRRDRIWARPVVPLALRGLTVTALVALVVALVALSGGGAPQQQANVPGETAIVASALSVLDTRTNTLYVVDPVAATLTARDATTNAQLSKLSLGGHPTALALNAAANTVVVLDAQQKSVVAVDATRNAVVSTITVDVPGTPTGINVEPSGKLLVSASTTTADGAKPSGVVAIVDKDKTVGVITVDVAPKRLVVEPSGGRVLLVSAAGTTLADARTFATLDRLVGGLDAAFSSTGDGGAVLSTSGTGARLSFWGAKAPTPLQLDGTPLALAPTAAGGFAVLLASGGASHIALVSAAGNVQGTIDVAGAGTALTFDPTLERFAVLGPGGSVAFAPQPGPTSAVQPTSAPATQAPATPSPSPSPTGTPTTTTAPTLVPSTPESSAAAALGGVTRFALPDGKQPFLARAAAGRIWFVDQSNALNSLVTSSRGVFTFRQLPNDAIIRGLAVSPNYVYAVDSHSGLTVFSIATERAVTQAYPFLSSSAYLLTTSLDDTLWIAKAGGNEIISYEPRTRAVNVVDVVDGSLSALATDDSGRIWFANESRKSIGYYDALTARLVEFPVARRGSVTSLLPTKGTLWAGTDVGELLAVRGDQLALAASVGARVTALVLGPSGAWYEASSPAGVVYAPLNGGATPRIAPSSARTLAFDAAGSAWLSDPSAALFYVIGTGVP